MNDETRKGELAAIQYVGVAGVSSECQEAVLRYLQCGDKITHVTILSSDRDFCRDHALLLQVDGDVVAVKSGFASGYWGEGPRTFSYVLAVLDSLAAEFTEFDVTEDFIGRLDSSALTDEDLRSLDSTKRLRPSRWPEYVTETHLKMASNGTLFSLEFTPIIPLGIVDSRIVKLATRFWDGPDHALMTGYRRLEDLVRQRTDSQESGSKLFTEAFNPKDGFLTWRDVDNGERHGRMQLFSATYTAHRNRRAHREARSDSSALLSEFLVLNHLYRLEAEAIASEQFDSFSND